MQSSINETSGNDFIIRKDGEIMLLVDSVGSIYMKGSLKNYYDSDMVFKDSFGDIVAHIDDYGNVVLAGSLEESSTHSRTSSPEWIINSGGDDVLILDQSSGSLYIDGTLSTVSNVTGSEFVYEDVFSVDSSGNVQITGSLVENNTFSSEKLKYDSRGNLISDYSYNYVYDDFGQLSVVMDGDSVIERYYYDHTGNRIKKVAGDETTYYAGDFVRIVNSSGTFDTLYYYLNGVMVAKNSSGVVSYYHPDHLGSTTLVTDISGAVVEDIDYLPYGGLIGSSNEDRLYEGKELDDTGLEYFGARYYNPGLRMFTQVDPVMDIYNPQNLNRYSFELNNPVKFVDPTGRTPVTWLKRAGQSIKTNLKGTADSISGSISKTGNLIKQTWNSMPYSDEAELVWSFSGAQNAGKIGKFLYDMESRAAFGEEYISNEELMNSGTDAAEGAAYLGLNFIGGVGDDAARGGKAISRLISPSNTVRIQNAAKKINKNIYVVGSRASGKANAFSDWDYVIEGATSKEKGKVKNSLPRGIAGGEIVGTKETGIDIFSGPVDTTKPYIKFEPR